MIDFNDVIKGDKVFVVDISKSVASIKEITVDTLKRINDRIYSINDELFHKRDSTLYRTKEEAIDRLRYFDYIDNFYNTTFSYYLDYIIDAIKNTKNVYVIRGHASEDKYVDICRIIEVRYNGKKNIWELKLQSVTTNIKTVHNANSLGLRIYFSKINALDKLLSSKGTV